MKASVHHIGYGQIEYSENFWSGKRELSIGGEKLTKKKKNVYTLSSENGELECRIKGSFLMGATLYIDQDVIQLSAPCKWYENFCSILIFAFVLTWGNIPQLCEIIPIVGGAIGGAISGLGAITNLLLMRRVKRVGLKLLVWLGMFFATVLTCFLVAQFILLLLYL
jgi:hypothetical protein